MPTICFVPGCRTGYPEAEKKTFFLPPKDPDLFALWKKSLPRVNSANHSFTSKHRVCEKHFMECDIERDFIHFIKGEEVKIPRGKVLLKPGAIPTIFPDVPIINLKMENSNIRIKCEILSDSIEPANEQQREMPISEDQVVIKQEANDDTELVISKVETVKLCQGIDILGCKEFAKLKISFVSLNDVTIREGKIFNAKCAGVFNRGNMDSRCKKCRYTYRLLQFRNKRWENKIIMETKRQSKLQNLKRSLKTCKLRNEELTDKVQVLEEINNRKSDEILAEAIRVLPSKQQEVVKHFFKNSNRHDAGIRFTKDWLFEASVMRVKSPDLYKYLRQKQILVLPSKSTINRFIQKKNNSEKVVDALTLDKNSSEENGVIVCEEMNLSEDFGDCDEMASICES